MLEIYTWSVFITGLFFTSFGAFAYFRNPRALTTRMFALLSVAFAVWSYSWFAMLLSKNYEQAILFSKLLNFGATFIPIFYLHWVLAVVGFTRSRTILLGLGYAITFVFAALSLTDLYIVDVRPVLDFPYWPVGGWVYILYVLIGYVGFVSYSIVRLVQKFKQTEGVEKHQIGYLLLGALLGFGGGATNFPLMFGFENYLPVFGIFLTMSSPFIFSYAAIRYNLMNIKVVAVQFLVGVLNLVFLINLILADTVADRFFSGFFLVMVFFLSILLVRSVMQEIRARQEIERLAKDLEKANIRLKELDQLKSEFLSLATHQLRSPLAAIKGYASLIMEGSFGVVSKAIQEAAGKIFQSSQSLVNIVEDFLNISRIEQGKMKYEMTEVDLEALIKEVVGELIPNVERAKLHISFSTDNRGPYKTSADPGKMRQVFGNLIDNAIKYTKEGSISVTLTKPSSEKLLAKVSDTGVGMDAHTIGKLFEKFSRAKDANETNTAGTGLGLYVAKEMAKAHDGKLWAESEGKGKGSTFLVELKSL